MQKTEKMEIEQNICQLANYCRSCVTKYDFSETTTLEYVTCLNHCV